MKTLTFILLLCFTYGVASAEKSEAPALEAPSAEVLPILVNTPPFSPPAMPSPPPSVSPPPSMLIPNGCPGISVSLLFSGYTADTFSPTQVEAFCDAFKSATSWYTTICAVTSVLEYPSPLPSVVVTAYILFEPENDKNLSTDIITAGYFRDLLLNNLNQTTLLPVIFGSLASASSVEIANECFSYSAIALGYVCSNKSTDCILHRGCFMDSDGKEYMKHLFADTFTCSVRTAPSPQPCVFTFDVVSRDLDVELAQNLLLDILTAPSPESEGNNSTSPSPIPSTSPSPSPSPVPSPPVTPSICKYVGTYRLQSVACPGQYIAVFPSGSPSCGDRRVVLRTSVQAPGARIRWKLNTTAVGNDGVPAHITSIRNCQLNSVHLTSPSGDHQPTLGGSSWGWQVIPSGSNSCSNVNIMATSRLSDGPFLAVNSTTCDSFVWSNSGGPDAEFKAIRT